MPQTALSATLSPSRISYPPHREGRYRVTSSTRPEHHARRFVPTLAQPGTRLHSRLVAESYAAHLQHSYRSQPIAVPGGVA